MLVAMCASVIPLNESDLLEDRRQGRENEPSICGKRPAAQRLPLDGDNKRVRYF